MQQISKWKPTKFSFKDGKLIPLSCKYSSSYRMANYIATFYNYAIPKFVKGCLLDLGCGDVPLYEYYVRHVEKIICVDWNNSYHDNCHLDISCDLNNNLPLNSDSFDTIICSDVLEHISEPFNLMSEINRVLKPGGYLLLNYPFIYGIHEAPHDHLRYTEYFIRSVTKKMKLEVIECFPLGNLLDILDHVGIRILNRIRFNKPFILFWYKIFMPSIRYFFNSKMELNNKHPYLYGFVIQKPIS